MQAVLVQVFVLYSRSHQLFFFMLPALVWAVTCCKP